MKRLFPAVTCALALAVTGAAAERPWTLIRGHNVTIVGHHLRQPADV